MDEPLAASALARLADIAATFLADHRAPGLSVAYARAGQLHHAGAFGFADRDAGAQLTTAHRFRIASLSKPLTAMAVMVLVERGVLRLEDRVFGPDGRLSRFDIERAASPRDWLAAITVDHLLTHEGGGWSNGISDPMFRHIRLDHDELIATIVQSDALITRPGERWAYSNFGYCLLGRIIEAASRQGYADFVGEALLAPAGVTGMAMAGDTLAERQPDEVAYFGQDGDPYRMNVSRMDAHGGWLATPSELVQVMIALDGGLLRPDTQAKMFSPCSEEFYARGWIINPAHGNRWHDGGLPGTTTFMVKVADGTHFAGLVNTRTDEPEIHGGLERLLWDMHGVVMG